ncbi:AAA family ATPase [Pseudomonas sp. gcc21]|uniref:AAA family ATPase n=1 Tax=Pseudomonas sp. gcc21 TaxID=2726989 RepID=UPI001451D60C|nr:AAA family ATPase [Pseudomonas sp. gcc21]QJD59442.1 AAA family ATPase [Pseudomonas sp. gcc21]
MNAESKPDYAAVEADLLSHYELSHDPFLPRTPGFRFFTARRKSVLAELHHLARFAQQLMVVTGPRSSGKTLLRQVLVASSNKDHVQCVVASARELTSADLLLGFITQAINAPARTEAGVRDKAAELFQTGIQLYIVIDDAHLLDPQVLQSLADLSQIDMRGAPRVFLFAEPSIDAALRTVQMPPERAWLHTVELQPFRPDETRDYLAQRLEAAGQGLELLSDDQLDWIHRQSEGWPGRINLVAREAMLAAIAPPALHPQRGSAFPLRSLIALILVSIAVAVVWMMGGSEPEPERTVLELPKPVATIDVLDADAAGSGGQPLNIAPPPSRSAPLPAETIPELVPSEAEPVVEIEPFSAEQIAPASQTGGADPAPRGPGDEQSASGQAGSSQVNTPEPTGSSGWYRQQPSGSYALQLLGTRSEQAAADFVTRHSALSDLYYFETVHEGKPWFVVTQGAYAGRTQAQQAIAGLPEAVRKLKPWPRSMAGIQQSLP